MAHYIGFLGLHPSSRGVFKNLESPKHFDGSATAAMVLPLQLAAALRHLADPQKGANKLLLTTSNASSSILPTARSLTDLVELRLLVLVQACVPATACCWSQTFAWLE
jgi:hypothetical protein